MVNCTGENCPFKGTTKEEAAVCDNSSYCICVSPPKKAAYKTNAAKIRMMTDEELADEILYILNHVLWMYNDSRLGLLDWLKQEVKG